MGERLTKERLCNIWQRADGEGMLDEPDCVSLRAHIDTLEAENAGLRRRSTLLDDLLDGSARVLGAFPPRNGMPDAQFRAIKSLSAAHYAFSSEDIVSAMKGERKPS